VRASSINLDQAAERSRSPGLIAKDWNLYASPDGNDLGEDVFTRRKTGHSDRWIERPGVGHQPGPGDRAMRVGDILTDLQCEDGWWDSMVDKLRSNDATSELTYGLDEIHQALGKE